ncbi:MAG: FHA domain-containing protein, partial [Planctomycetota bacterium]
MASLQLIDDVALDRRIFLPDDQTWLIGRGRECDVRLRDSSISREHARIVVESGLYYLEDLDSRNGTFLNEAPVHAAVPLYDGDVLRISRFAFTFRSDGDGLAETFDDESTMIAPQAGEPADGFSTEEFVARMSVAETSIAEPAPDGAETGIDRQLRVILQLLHDVKSTHDLDVSLPLILGAACELFPQCENAQIAVVRSDGRIVTRADHCNLGNLA